MRNRLATSRPWSLITPARGRDVAYRLVARDNRPGQPNESVSSTVIFSAPSQGDVAKQRNELEQSAFANLQKVIELQKRNIADTERFQKAMKTTEEAQWNKMKMILDISREVWK